jgi:hypothetical protein
MLCTSLLHTLTPSHPQRAFEKWMKAGLCVRMSAYVRASARLCMCTRIYAYGTVKDAYGCRCGYVLVMLCVRERTELCFLRVLQCPHEAIVRTHILFYLPHAQERFLRHKTQIRARLAPLLLSLSHGYVRCHQYTCAHFAPVAVPLMSALYAPSSPAQWRARDSLHPW